MEVRTTAQFRDESGRFIRAVEAGATKGAEDLASMIAQIASGSAWSRSGPVHAHATGIAKAEAVAEGDLAPIQEFGARPHVISTMKGALANPETGFFVPNPFVRRGARSSRTGMVSVNHPGVKAQHFLSRAAAAASSMGAALIARNLPR